MLYVNSNHEKIVNMKVTRQEVLGLNDAVGSLPKDIKDFEYQLCVIENAERLSKAVEKIKEALKAAASEDFLNKSQEISEKAAKIMQESKSKVSWPEAMTQVLDKLSKKDREAYQKMQEEQAKLEADYLGKESDIELYKISKADLPKPFPLDQAQTIAFKYFIKE